MATAYITEFGSLAAAANGMAQIAMLPPIASQTITVGAETDTATLNVKTRFVRVHTDAICSLTAGGAPTATTAILRMAADQTEYFGVPAGGNYKISIIANT